MPRPLKFHTPNRRGVRLPLEGKLAQRQLRLMRSKLAILTIGWYDTVPFDLIRHGLWPVTPSPRERRISEGSAAFYYVRPYTPSVSPAD